MAKKNSGIPPQQSTTAVNSNGTPQQSTTAVNSNGTPQQSTTAVNSNGTPQQSTTAVNSNGTPQQSTSAVNNGQNRAPQPSAKKPACPRYSSYVIDGITYNVVDVISEQSGEAIIFKVENNGNNYALKLYRRGVTPNHDVLQRIMENRGNRLLVDIYAHGKWHDSIGGVDYHYEVMQYCQGGSLANIRLNGNEERLKKIAIQMASALDYAHKLGIIHRDIKPANFLFTDKKHINFVLTDWGLAKILDSKGRAQNDAGRTKIYAAPEMYTYIPGTPTYIGTKADFFSMGMALLALWMGEGKLLADETKLVHDKQEETLPYPAKGEMSSHTLGLIKALTRRNPDIRAGLDDIVKWSKGESIFDDNSNDNIANFRIVFNGQAGLIAHSPKELSEIMWKNSDLAIRYLYNDDISDWLRDNNRPELAIEIEDITENRYPGNRQSGLLAACLTLNPDMPYPFFSGNKQIPINDFKELATSLGNGTLDDSNVTAMSSQNFLMWAATRDQILAGKAMQNPNDCWYIAYSLLPDVGYDFKPIKTSKAATPEQLAQLITEEICGHNIPIRILFNLGTNWDRSRLHGYLKSKGIYDNHISNIRFYLNLNSDDNQKKFVPYTLRIAQFKIATLLMGKVPQITIGGITFRTANDVISNQFSLHKLSQSQSDLIADWLSLFYQEEPGADYRKKSYLQRTIEYGNMTDNLPGCSYSKNSANAKLNLANEKKRYENTRRKVSIWRWVGILLGFTPLLLMCLLCILMTLDMGAVDFSDALGKVGYWIGIGVGILVGLIVWIESENIFAGGISGLICFAITKAAFSYLGLIVPWIIIAVMLIVLVFLSKKLFSEKLYHFYDKYNNSSISKDEVINRYYIAKRFNCFHKVFPNSYPSNYPCCVYQENTNKAENTLKNVRKNSIFMLVTALVGAILCSFTINSVSNDNEYEDTTNNFLIDGSYTGDIAGTPTTINFINYVDGKLEAHMQINYRSGTTNQVMYTYSTESFPIVLYKSDSNYIYLRIDSVYTDEDGKVVAKGIYYNSQRNTRSVNMIQDVLCEM